jgi:hypothetical protein
MTALRAVAGRAAIAADQSDCERRDAANGDQEPAKEFSKRRLVPDSRRENWGTADE